MANENQYYKYPFAENGNADEVPDQGAGGVVDYESGYGPDYEKAVGEEGRKRIERTSFNGLFNGATKNIKQHQEHNWPTWIEDDGSSDPAVPFSYDAGVVVYHNGQAWVSLLGSNTDEPTGISGKWRLYKTNSGIEVDGDGGVLTQTLSETQEILDKSLTNEGTLLTDNGYTKLGNGMIMQWGNIVLSADTEDQVSFPLPFPNAVISISGGALSQGVRTNDGVVIQFRNLTNNSVIINRQDIFATSSISYKMYYMVIGY